MCLLFCHIGYSHGWWEPRSRGRRCRWWVKWQQQNAHTGGVWNKPNQAGWGGEFTALHIRLTSWRFHQICDQGSSWDADSPAIGMEKKTSFWLSENTSLVLQLLRASKHDINLSGLQDQLRKIWLALVVSHTNRVLFPLGYLAEDSQNETELWPSALVKVGWLLNLWSIDSPKSLQIAFEKLGVKDPHFRNPILWRNKN